MLKRLRIRICYKVRRFVGISWNRWVEDWYSERDGFNYNGIYKQDGVELVEVILGVGQFADHHGEYNRHKIRDALLQYIF